ncbi:MAG: Wadjet anti-phage system protein JetD domain-containing protein, partial [Acidimicrobiales bacterium]
LMAINDWLVATKGGRVPTVPHRIRSAEILGDEKAFDELSRSALFMDGRLSWELLAATPIEPPLALRRIGPRGGVLVVENSDPYWLCVEALAGQEGTIGLVVWGQGQAGIRSLPTLAREPYVTGPVWYWGDFDPTGLAIPIAASAGVEAAGLGPLRPAEPFYEAMADHAERTGGTECRTAWGERDRSSWLGVPLWKRFSPVVGRGRRVAQEVLGPEQVRIVAASLGVDTPVGPA